MAAIDLHAHTTASDGTLAPRDLVALAHRHGVRVLAITDHDSTEGVAEAQEAGARLGMTIVPGIEINCDVEPSSARPAGAGGGAGGSEVHVLGYFVDVDAPWFQEFLRAQRAERTARVHRITARLAELGIFIEAAEVLALVKEGSPGRPHVAQVLVRHGYVKSVREAFDRYLRSGGPANVPRKRLTPAEAVAVIRRAGGVPVMAHPALAGRDAMIPDLVRAGLMGVETYYPEHSPGQVRAYLDLCVRLGLVATGGSDYHGPPITGPRPPGSPRVPWTAWERLQARGREVRAERDTAVPGAPHP